MNCNLRLVGVRRLGQCYLRVKNDEMLTGVDHVSRQLVWARKETLVVMNNVGRGH